MGDHSEWHYMAGMLFNHNKPAIKFFLCYCGLNVNLSIIGPWIWTLSPQMVMALGRLLESCWIKQATGDRPRILTTWCHFLSALCFHFGNTMWPVIMSFFLWHIESLLNLWARINLSFLNLLPFGYLVTTMRKVANIYSFASLHTWQDKKRSLK